MLNRVTLAEIFGLPIDSALTRVGSMEQFARVDSFVRTDGRGRGARCLRVVNGGGLEFEVHPDRALDLGATSFDGIPLAWISPVGAVAPWAYEPSGRDWLRSFGGGLLATCGLDNFGPPADDEDGVVGMHGRVGGIPAQLTVVEGTTDRITIAGVVRQSAVFAENLVLRRTITTAVGSGTLAVDDVVTNDGPTSWPHMILYHFNLGWPLVNVGTVMDIPAAAVAPRDPDARSGFESRYRVEAPEQGFSEQVFIHEQAIEPQHVATVTNAGLGMRFTLRYSPTLPVLFEWKMTAPQNYVLGLEPANTSAVMGRQHARSAGRLPRLEPGQSTRYHLEVEAGRL